MSKNFERQMSEPQPDPKPSSKTPVWILVTRDMLDRDEFGRKKYGTRLQSFNGRNALVDLYQELLDATVYVRQVIEEDPLEYIRIHAKEGLRVSKKEIEGIKVALSKEDQLGQSQTREYEEKRGYYEGKSDAYRFILDVIKGWENETGNENKVPPSSLGACDPK